MWATAMSAASGMFSPQNKLQRLIGRQGSVVLKRMRTKALAAAKTRRQVSHKWPCLQSSQFVLVSFTFLTPLSLLLHVLYPDPGLSVCCLDSCR